MEWHSTGTGNPGAATRALATVRIAEIGKPPEYSVWPAVFYCPHSANGGWHLIAIDQNEKKPVEIPVAEISFAAVVAWARTKHFPPDNSWQRRAPRLNNEKIVCDNLGRIRLMRWTGSEFEASGERAAIGEVQGWMNLPDPPSKEGMAYSEYAIPSKGWKEIPGKYHCINTCQCMLCGAGAGMTIELYSHDEEPWLSQASWHCTECGEGGAADVLDQGDFVNDLGYSMPEIIRIHHR